MTRERLIRKAWLSSGYSCAEWRQQLLSLNPAEFMRQGELGKLQALPDEFIVYRGYQPPSPRDGISWTLDRTVAEFFSKINPHRPVGEVEERVVRKSDVFALLDNGWRKPWNEVEILIAQAKGKSQREPRCTVCGQRCVVGRFRCRRCIRVAA